MCSFSTAQTKKNSVKKLVKTSDEFANDYKYFNIFPELK